MGKDITVWMWQICFKWSNCDTFTLNTHTHTHLDFPQMQAPYSILFYCHTKQDLVLLPLKLMASHFHDWRRLALCAQALLSMHNKLCQIPVTEAESKYPLSGPHSCKCCDVFAIMVSSLTRCEIARPYIRCWYSGIKATLIKLILKYSVAHTSKYFQHDVVKHYCQLVQHSNNFSVK